MLYLDYSRKAGEWVPNEFGGREDLDAVAFLQELNETLYARDARASSRRPRSRPPGPASRGRPTSAGSASASSGTWAGCTTRSRYFAHDPIHRRYHHHELTFCAHLRVQRELHPAALARRGRARQGLAARRRCRATAGSSFANLRALYALHVGAPRQEAPVHGRRARRRGPSGATSARSTGTCSSTPSTRACSALVRDLNRVYRVEPALWELDFDPARLPLARGERRRERTCSRSCGVARRRRAPLVCVAQPLAGAARAATASACRAAARWRELLNTDSRVYGGGGVGNLGGVERRGSGARGTTSRLLGAR